MLRPAAGQCPLKGDFASSHTRTGGARPVYAGELWGSSTLAWNAAWFHAQGVMMPKGAHYVVHARDKIPLTDKVDPADTGVMRLQFRQIR